MICNNCKKTIDDDSKFCPFCGSKIEEKKPEQEDDLWKHFTDLSFEGDKDKRQKNRDKTPPAIREVIRRFSTNLFDSLKEDNESILDLSYETLEDIRNSYYFLAEDGYWAYVANSKVKGHKSHKLEDRDVEELVEDWNDNFVKNNEKGKKLVDEEVLETIIASSKHQVNTLLENHGEIKKLPARVIEKIKGDLFIMPYWIYGCCVLSERKED